MEPTESISTSQNTAASTLDSTGSNSPNPSFRRQPQPPQPPQPQPPHDVFTKPPSTQPPTSPNKKKTMTRRSNSVLKSLKHSLTALRSSNNHSPHDSTSNNSADLVEHESQPSSSILNSKSYLTSVGGIGTTNRSRSNSPKRTKEQAKKTRNHILGRISGILGDSHSSNNDSNSNSNSNSSSKGCKELATSPEFLMAHNTGSWEEESTEDLVLLRPHTDYFPTTTKTKMKTATSNGGGGGGGRFAKVREKARTLVRRPSSLFQKTAKNRTNQDRSSPLPGAALLQDDSSELCMMEPIIDSPSHSPGLHRFLDLGGTGNSGPFGGEDDADTRSVDMPPTKPLQRPSFKNDQAFLLEQATQIMGIDQFVVSRRSIEMPSDERSVDMPPVKPTQRLSVRQKESLDDSASTSSSSRPKHSCKPSISDGPTTPTLSRRRKLRTTSPTMPSSSHGSTKPKEPRKRHTSQSSSSRHQGDKEYPESDGGDDRSVDMPPVKPTQRLSVRQKESLNDSASTASSSRPKQSGKPSVSDGPTIPASSRRRKLRMTSPTAPSRKHHTNPSSSSRHQADEEYPEPDDGDGRRYRVRRPSQSPKARLSSSTTSSDDGRDRRRHRTQSPSSESRRRHRSKSHEKHGQGSQGPRKEEGGGGDEDRQQRRTHSDTKHRRRRSLSNSRRGDDDGDSHSRSGQKESCKRKGTRVTRSQGHDDRRLKQTSKSRSQSPTRSNTRRRSPITTSARPRRKSFGDQATIEPCSQSDHVRMPGDGREVRSPKRRLRKDHGRRSRSPNEKSERCHPSKSRDRSHSPNGSHTGHNSVSTTGEMSTSKVSHKSRRSPLNNSTRSREGEKGRHRSSRMPRSLQSPNSITSPSSRRKKPDEIASPSDPSES